MAEGSEILEITATEPKPKDFLEPIDFILAEHYRQRLLCEGLAKLTEKMELAPVAALATRLQGFLAHDLNSVHHPSLSQLRTRSAAAWLA